MENDTSYLCMEQMVEAIVRYNPEMWDVFWSLCVFLPCNLFHLEASLKPRVVARSIALKNITKTKRNELLNNLNSLLRQRKWERAASLLPLSFPFLKLSSEELSTFFIEPMKAEM